jgi:hypothetical protein
MNCRGAYTTDIHVSDHNDKSATTMVIIIIFTYPSAILAVNYNTSKNNCDTNHTQTHTQGNTPRHNTTQRNTTQYTQQSNQQKIGFMASISSQVLKPQ